MQLEALAARNRARTQAKNRPTLRQQARLALLRLYAGVMPAPRAELADLPDDARFLVIRPDHLGDVLFATPALSLLRQARPHAHITAMVGPWAARILHGNPDVDEVLTCPFPGFTRQLKRSAWEPYGLLNDYAKNLSTRKFDGALILRRDHWWGALLAHRAHIPLRYGTAHPTVAPFLTAALPLGPDRSIADVCALLGVPRRDWHLFRRWAGESLSSKALDQLHAYVDVMIAERCRNPGDDLLSQLIETGLDGEDLTVDDFRAIVASLAARAV